MIRRRLWMLASLVSCIASVSLAANPTYTVVAPTQPGFVCAYPATNKWMNCSFVASGGNQVGVAKTVVDQNNTSPTKYSIVAAEVGFGWQRARPDYYLGDLVTPPDNVDWNATRAAYEASGSDAFLFNPDNNNPGVYAIAGGATKFTWYFKDGTSSTINYQISPTSSGRPKRIYWTDAPYNAPNVSLEGKFVQIIDRNGVAKIERGIVTNDIDGVQTVTDNAIVSGVYVDSSSMVMYAKGKREGQFILVYYDTGDYKNILCIQVIEVARPEAITCTGIIGQELKPTGLGYDNVDALTARVTAGINDSDDERGDYLYQHSGEQSYSPKNKAVFAIRPSVGKRWKAEIYWMETDPMGVQWPFELDQYENDWPASGHLYTRGDLNGDTGAKIYIPTKYSAELCEYQESADHALAVDGNNVFYTKGEGWSLLKLTADDNIWFVPLHSVNRSNSDYYTLESHEVKIGEEFHLQGGSQSGIALGAKELVSATEDAPAYLYRPASGGQYNIDLYRETTNATDSAGSSGATSSDGVPSAVFAVNEGDTDIEVWWSHRLQKDDMPYWIDIPCLPQVYHPVWPDTTGLRRLSSPRRRAARANRSSSSTARQPSTAPSRAWRSSRASTSRMARA